MPQAVADVQLFEPSIILRMVGCLTDEERREFHEGWAQAAFRLAKSQEAGYNTECAKAAQDFLEYVKSWVVSIALRSDEEWQQQVAETAAMYPGDVA